MGSKTPLEKCHLIIHKINTVHEWFVVLWRTGILNGVATAQAPSREPTCLALLCQLCVKKPKCRMESFFPCCCCVNVISAILTGATITDIFLLQPSTLPCFNKFNPSLGPNITQEAGNQFDCFAQLLCKYQKLDILSLWWKTEQKWQNSSCFTALATIGTLVQRSSKHFLTQTKPNTPEIASHIIFLCTGWLLLAVYLVWKNNAHDRTVWSMGFQNKSSVYCCVGKHRTEPFIEHRNWPHIVSHKSLICLLLSRVTGKGSLGF